MPLRQDVRRRHTPSSETVVARNDCDRRQPRAEVHSQKSEENVNLTKKQSPVLPLHKAKVDAVGTHAQAE
uniref:Uncharacterized protein n=1 Tax=Steinernema glaseri TaxID=37863 RepID=A0A1I7ZUV5_9BILA